jgi:hypothetical protein
MIAQIRAYRERVLNADTLEQIQALAVEIIGHCEGLIDDDDARSDLLDYLAEWQSDCERAEKRAVYIGRPFFDFFSTF